MSLYSSFSAKKDGQKLLASARLRYRILSVLHQALEESGLTKTDLAKRLNIRRSAVGNVFKGDGNLRINTLAEYLIAMDRELVVSVVDRGVPRQLAGSAVNRTTLAVSGIVSRGGYKRNNEAVYLDARNPVKVA